MVCNERKQLLPRWVRFFSWIFLLFLASPIVLIVGIFVRDMHYNFYGIPYHGPILHPLPIAIVILMTLHGIAAYGLLWGRRWGVDVGIACGVIDAAGAVAGMVIAFVRRASHYESSLIVLVIFLMTLFDIRKEWLAIKEDKPAKQAAAKGAQKLRH